jgi:glutamate N-acetyltransferase/amino-acid N-acetyltransferase
MCSGASGVEIAPETEDELRFGEALDALLRQLALDIVRDGEGAARVGRVVVTGGDGEAVERSARGVANSPLVKAALNGGDPNWARFDAAALAERVARDEVEYVVGLPGEGFETEVFFSDLSHGYVTINADYTT